MMVLDTHVLVWWVSGEKQLSSKTRKLIDGELKRQQGLILISSISVWEIALLAGKGRLSLTMSVDDWIINIAGIPGLRFVPVDNRLAIESSRLPGEFHPDPADRLIVALARQEGAQLVTADKKILDYRHVRTIQA